MGRGVFALDAQMGDAKVFEADIGLDEHIEQIGNAGGIK